MSFTSPLASRFLSALPPKARARAPETSELEAHLQQVLAAALMSWPQVKASVDGFMDHLARCAAESDDPFGALDKLRTSDLYLAQACAEGDTEAVAKVSALIGEHAPAALIRQQLSSADITDLTQNLRRQLLIPDLPHHPVPRISEFGGRAPLGRWIRASAVNLALKLKKSLRSQERFADAAVPSAPPNEETLYLRGRYGKDFKAAFEEAFGALSESDRTFLRLHLLDGLNFTEISRVFQIHPSNASRRYGNLCDKLLKEVRRRLLIRLNLTPAEFDSLRLELQSALELSLRRVLKSPA